MKAMLRPNRKAAVQLVTVLAAALPCIVSTLMSLYGFDVPSQVDVQGAVSPHEVKPSGSATIATRTKVPKGQRDFRGCWSSGDGKVVHITEKEIFSSTNVFKPVKYVIEPSADHDWVLKLLDRPQFYFFQRFISFEFESGKESFPLIIKDYQSIDDLRNSNISGTSWWMTFNCEEWFSDHN